MSRLTTTTVSAVTMALVLFANAAEARIYRYTDDNGQLVLGTSVPQHATSRGYEILNDAGRVITTIAPAPTAEELVERERLAREREQAERQRQSDQRLLRQFSHPDDAVRTLNRKLQELSSAIQLKRSTISGIIKQLDNEQSHAANLERSGRAVPESTLEKISRMQSQIRGIEQEISVQNTKIDTTKSEFIKYIKRLEEMTGQHTGLAISIAPEKN